MDKKVLTEETWLEMFEMIPEVADLVLAQSKWRDTKEESGVVPEIMRLVHEQKRKYGNYKISYGLSFMEQGMGTLTNCLDTDKNPTNDWTNQDAKEKYKQAALAICKEYKADYLALAIEVNTYYQHPQGSKEDFERFVEFYIKTYDELKKECPDTKIFVTFQLEELKGLGDASWGHNVEPEWELLEMFDGKLDVIAFTTYPFLEYNFPEDIPADYYTSILDDLIIDDLFKLSNNGVSSKRISLRSNEKENRGLQEFIFDLISFAENFCDIPSDEILTKKFIGWFRNNILEQRAKE